jgi:hypothetical protein
MLLFFVTDIFKKYMKFYSIKLWINFFFAVVQQTKSDLGLLIVEVSRTHTIRHTQPVGLFWTNDQLNAEAATFTTHNKHKTRTPMPSKGFEPMIPAIKQP